MAKKDSDFHKLKLNPAFKAAKKFKTLPVLKPPSLDGTDPELTALIKRVGGDRNIAKRIMRLAEQFPAASVPELIVYTWLQKEGLNFDFQVELYGGRRFEGGLLPDFVVYQDRTHATAWQIQGSYWHSIARKGFHDQTSQWRMLGQVVNGATIGKVIEIWENDLYMGRHVQTLFYALAGISMRGIGGT